MSNISPGGARIEKKPKKKKDPNKSHTGRSILIGILIGLAVVAAGVALFLKFYIRPPMSDSEHMTPDSDSPSISNPDGSDDSITSLPPGLTVREGVYSFVVAGQRDGNTDTLMVALLDTKAGKLNVISVPRDTVVDASRKMKKINAAYSVGGGKAKGMEQLRKEMATLVGFVPRNYACVDMKGFVRLVDTIDGVDFDVPMRMYLPEEGINLRAGQQHLNGDKALQLVRFRGYGPSAGKLGIDHDDYGRMQMQQNLLKAIAKQTLQLGNLFKVGDFIDIASKDLLSSLDAGNMLWLAEQCMKLDSDDIIFHTLPTYSVKYAGSSTTTGTYYEIVKSKEALELINSTINPYTTPITADMVSWLVLK